MTDLATVLWSEFRELVRNSSKVVIHKICLQLGITTFSSVEMLSDLVFWDENWTLLTAIAVYVRKIIVISETYLLNFLSVIEDILVLLITDLNCSFTSFLSRYSTFFCVSLRLLLLHIYFSPVRNQLAFYRMCNKPAIQSWHFWWKEIAGVTFFDWFYLY